MSHKIAKDEKESFLIEEKYIGLPHGWIQWKGTDARMDIYYKCGNHSHFDGEFCYNIKCPECGTTYTVNGHVEFVEIKEEPYILKEGDNY